MYNYHYAKLQHSPRTSRYIKNELILYEPITGRVGGLGCLRFIW